jgi:Ca2+-binding EF-hand superfamily protein
VKSLNKVLSVVLAVGLIALFVAPAFAIIGDINGDGKVDNKDLVLMAKAYGSKPGDANWDPRCDLNNNGVVDLTDLVTLAYHYGEHSP